MRIVIDLQGAQTESRFRGIGRYTMSFAKAVVRNRREHEVFLALSALFPDTIDAIRSAFEGLLPQENILVWHSIGPVSERFSENSNRREISEHIREAFLASLMPDVVHLTSLFEGYVDDAVTSVGLFDRETLTSVMLYDLIPLQNPQNYLDPDPRYAKYYHQKIKHLRNASTYLAISEFSKNEGIEVLGEPATKFNNISTAIDDNFKCITLADVSVRPLLEFFGVFGEFILCVGGADERKNLPRLIEAYAELPLNVRAEHQILFVGKMSEDDVLRFKEVGRSFGLNDSNLIFAGYVGDDVLVQLYSLCKLYVFPSWHEGFGLPALEAMACGAPVITSNCSSLPEVVGWAGAMFNPFEVKSITHKINHALTSDSFRSELRERGLKQAKNFSWERTAQKAIEVWECLVDKAPAKETGWRHSQKYFSEIHKKLIFSIATVYNCNEKSPDFLLKLIALNLYSNEALTQRVLRSAPLPEQITWRLEGPFDSSYSLALVNREIARALKSLGHIVLLHSTEGSGDFLPDAQYLSLNPDLADMYQRTKDVEHVNCDIVSRNLYPPRVLDMSARLNFLHGFAWEESGFPLSWVDNFNDALQGMTVTSQHVKKIMIDHGVTVPIDVTWNGVDHWERIIEDPEYVLKARSFRFLHVSSCFPRKGADVMLRSFGRAFRDTDDVTLVIKTFNNPHNEVHQLLRDLQKSDQEYPHVLIVEEDFSDEQLKALYRQCHALVAPSRAEGFGLPMAEAMLSGLAVITTNWSGQTDFCSDQSAWLIDYDFKPARSHFELPSSVWAEPDEKHLSELMREVYEMPKSLIQERITVGQKLLRQKFSWKNVAERMLLSARCCSQFKYSPTPRIGWITTWNTKCGIATYSEHLIRSMPTKTTIFASDSTSCIAIDADNVVRCWNSGDDELENLEKAIEKNDINVIVIQFNYGFFKFESLSRFINRQADIGRLVFITLHATADPSHAPDKKLVLLREALMRCQRVLIHSHNDMNRLKRIGVISNVTLLPHGIIDYVPPEKSSKPDEIIKLKSYGFFLPHKGLSELVDVVSILKDMGLKIQLEMVNSSYPAVESKNEIERVKAKIKKLGLEREVLLCTEFLTDEESLSKLSSADLIVFAYQQTAESASGAVRYGLATGRPVVVTPLEIFEDLAPAVHQLTGVLPSQIANGILDIINEQKSGSNKFLEKEKNALRWKSAIAYSRIGLRLYNMIFAVLSDKNRTNLSST